MQYKGESLELTVYACYLWEMALNVFLNMSFCNRYVWNMGEGGRSCRMKPYTTNDGTLVKLYMANLTQYLCIIIINV
jgi:hypothetical protein